MSSSSLTLVLIVQVRRYRRHHRAMPDGTQPAEGIDVTAPFATGGCCSCCVGDDDDRCCCCYCACCEPKGIQASYILGDELPPQGQANDDLSDFDVEEGRCCHDDNGSESDSHCHCCCNRKESEIEMTASPVEEAQETHVEEVSTTQQPQNPPPESPRENAPTVYLSSSIQLPTGETPVLHDVRLVRAVADDGSGKTVLIALPFPVCCCTRAGERGGLNVFSGKDTVALARVNTFLFFKMFCSPCNILYCLSGVFCGLWGNRGKKMTNYNYFTIYVVALIIAVVIEYLPSDVPVSRIAAA